MENGRVAKCVIFSVVELKALSFAFEMAKMETLCLKSD